MICVCPKCTDNIELDLVDIPEGGTAATCTSCSARFYVARELFAARATRKSDTLTCSQCGTQLGHGLHCPGCSLLFPDYYVTQSGKFQKRKTKDGASYQFSLSLGGGGGSTTSHAPTAIGGMQSSRKNLIRLAVLLLVVVALAVSAYFYNQYRRARLYAENFAKTLYVTKSGMDWSMKTSAKLIETWKSGKTATPTITPDDEKTLREVDKQVDLYMQRLVDTPKNFEPAMEKLNKLNGIYKQSFSLAVSPTGPMPAFTNSAAKLEVEFKTASQELKASLHPQIAVEVDKAKERYKAFKDF